MGYRFEATSLGGFVQQLAVSYVRNGHFFYVTGRIPARKAVDVIDRKLLERYGIGLSKWARARRKQAGWASVQYLRYERLFVLLATHGKHRFFEEEAQVIRDIRRVPLKVDGYSVSYRGGHAHVRIEQEEYKRQKAYFLDIAVHRTAEHLGQELHALRFEPYAPIRGQLFCILRAVNRRRHAAGYAEVPHSCLRLKRRIYRPFDPVQALENRGDEEAAGEGPPLDDVVVELLPPQGADDPALPSGELPCRGLPLTGPLRR
jgi:hypothetical protein